MMKIWKLPSFVTVPHSQWYFNFYRVYLKQISSKFFCFLVLLEIISSINSCTISGTSVFMESNFPTTPNHLLWNHSTRWALFFSSDLSYVPNASRIQYSSFWIFKCSKHSVDTLKYFFWKTLSLVSYTVDTSCVVKYNTSKINSDRNVRHSTVLTNERIYFWKFVCPQFLWKLNHLHRSCTFGSGFFFVMTTNLILSGLRIILSDIELYIF